MTDRQIEKLHRSMQTAEYREKRLLEAIGKLRRIIGGVQTIADINSAGCEDEWMAVLNSLSFADTYIGVVSEKFMRGKWWHWDKKVGGWVEGALKKGRGFDK